ncbi:hypothetical protein N0K08_09305 [Acidovorax sp. Be4]|uniref:Uncharacterized protein n=1 Tax=Acidovorax bellezanensis TaxID=2976702 RepID=A0ABT2PK20_9BURK|nr:hypothetical protein [Acidovorax sp. Be4]MCT9810831.1 hypothetical protein [Acidovorax sp. Be4]
MREDKRASEPEANVSEVDIVKPRATPTSATAPKRATTKTTAAKKPATKSAVAKKAVTKNGKTRKVPAGAKAKRNFPLSGLEECVKLVNTIKEFNAGNPWAPKEIARVLGVGLSNNYFYLTAACRDYGLTVGTRDTAKIELTDLGRSLAYPKSSVMYSEALNTAFRNVSLFQKVYDYYQGGVLPEIQYLKNTLKTEFGVEEQFQDDFYQLFQKNVAYLKAATGSSPIVGKTATAGSKSTSNSGDSIILGESTNSGKLVAFVAMPFSEKSGKYEQGYFDEVLKHLITPAAVKADFNARTAKKAGSEVIQSTIVNDLDSADLVIVDLTEHNPNVLFELGMRIAFNKPVCLIRAKGTPAIFDIDHMLRVFDYNPSIWPSTLATDVPALTEHILATWRDKERRSYLTILRDNKSD